MTRIPARIARYLESGRYRIVAFRRYRPAGLGVSRREILVAELVHVEGDLIDGHEQIWFALAAQEEIAWGEAELVGRPELEQAAPPDPQEATDRGDEDAPV